MNILARILSHGFAIAVVLLLAASFIHRGELFPGLPMPAFLGIEKQDTAKTEAVAEADTTQAGTQPEAAVATGVAPDPGAATAEAVVEAAGTETAAELAPAGETGPDADTTADTGVSTPTLREESEPQTATELPAPVKEEDTELTGATAETDTGETVSAAPQAAEKETASSGMAAESADTLPAAEAVAVPYTADVDDTVAEDTATDSAAAAPVEKTPAMELAPETVVSPPAETATEAPSPAPEAEPAPATPADAVEESAAPGDDAQPAEVAAPDAPAMDATPATEDATGETMLDMSRPYHVLAAAREAYWMRNHDEAESLYRRLIALEPENPDGYGELGNLYFTQGRWEDAASAYFEAGSRLVRTGNSQEAQNLLEVIRGLNGSQADELASIIAESR